MAEHSEIGDHHNAAASTCRWSFGVGTAAFEDDLFAAELGDVGRVALLLPAHGVSW